MADNVPITAGTGTDIATDDVSGVHFQKVKLIDGTADSSTAIPGDGTNGLDVDVTRVQGTVTVSATDLDIRNLVQATDAVKVGDGTNLIDVDVAPTDGEVNGGKRLLHTESWLWGYNGTTWDRLRSDTTNGLDVDVTRVSGSVTVAQGTAANLKAEVSQGTASNLQAQVTITGASTIGDAAGLWVRPFPGRAALAQGTASSTTTGSTSVIGGTASNYLYITSVVVHNSSATDTYINLQDGSGGTTLAVLPAAAKGGCVWQPATPFMVPTSGNGLFFAAGSGVTTMYVTAAGYKLTI